MENEILGQILAERQKLNVRQDGMDQRLNSMERQQNSLAEGQVTMQLQLDRIEVQVTVHDEILFKRVK